MQIKYKMTKQVRGRKFMKISSSEHYGKSAVCPPKKEMIQQITTLHTPKSSSKPSVLSMDSILIPGRKSKVTQISPNFK